MQHLAWRRHASEGFGREGRGWAAKECGQGGRAICFAAVPVDGMRSGARL
jgi:hypothetical protein